MEKSKAAKGKEVKRIKFLIATMGPGETIQGIALYNYLLKKGADVAFAVRMKMNCVFFKNQKQKARLYLTETPELFKAAFEKEKPDVLVLCNSKIVTYYKDFFQHPPLPKPVTVTLDSNWLFDKDGGWYSCADWLDRYFIIFPRKIFYSGLKKYGGNYEIPFEIMKRIDTVGFIPFFKKPSFETQLDIRKKYKIKKNQKLIFSYFSGYGAAHRGWAFDNLEKAIDVLIQKGLDIKVVYVGAKNDLSAESMKKEWLVVEEKLSIKDFYLVLASSDLVFQHQGLGTLSQAFSANIPVIANVMDLSDERHGNHAHAWELAPFVKLGLCDMFYKSAPSEEISNEIEKLLYDKKAIKKMKTTQKKYYFAGESNAYKIIKQLLKNKKYEETKNRAN